MGKPLLITIMFSQLYVVISISLSSFVIKCSSFISYNSRNLNAYVNKHGLGMTALKPAAIPLLESGKALARGGELLIDSTSSLEIYGGGISSAGASIRNAGDCIAQAAASCRFK